MVDYGTIAREHSWIESYCYIVDVWPMLAQCWIPALCRYSLILNVLGDELLLLTLWPLSV